MYNKGYEINMNYVCNKHHRLTIFSIIQYFFQFVYTFFKICDKILKVFYEEE